MSSNSSSTGSSQVPAVRTFQMDGSSQGNLSSSVNLFRGDVNLSQKLFSLPGRSGNSNLDVNVAAQYQSNVARDATTWNADAPTGILGLGWASPNTYIEASPSGSAVPATRQYTLYDNGSANQLVPQSIKPVLFSMSASLAGGLTNGSPIPASVRDEFLNHGLLVSATAVIIGSGPWTVDDADNQQQFTLTSGSQLEVRDGGEVYQLQNFQFREIVYYPKYERWLVVGDQGIRRSFGGQSPSTDKGFATAAGNSIRWSVWWSDGQNSVPAWTGPSNQIDGQVQVAEAWYLRSVSDRFGSRTEYSYNQFERNSAGIIPVVEQQVGTGGKPYTKAVYLSTIRDVFGRTVNYRYAEKSWDASPESPREYNDPHRPVPSNDPGPYQDQYETWYLSQIVVNDTSDDTLFTVNFSYELKNVTSNTGELKGDTYKRFLTSIILQDQDGIAEPGMLFSYDQAENTAGGQPGALTSITYPSGGTATYSYTKQDLKICDRTQAAARPTDVPAGATPRVFFGSDYAVVCYYNQNSLELSMQVYTWEGSWLLWQPPSSAVIDTQGINLDSLNVLAQQDFLVLTFTRTDGERAVYAYQKDTARPGQWQPATIDGVTTAKNTPVLTYSGGADASFAGGSTFFVVSRMDVGTLQGTYDVVTFRWPTLAWTKESFHADTWTWFTAEAEYYAALAMNGDLQIHYLNADLDWQVSATVSIPNLQTFDVKNVRLVPGRSLVVVANLTSSNNEQNTYVLSIAEWNGLYETSVSQHGPYTDNFGSNNSPLSWTPHVVEDTMVAVNGNLLRRNGGTWDQNTALNIGNPDAHTTQRFAYGPGYAIQIVAPTSGVGTASAHVMSYDPTAASPWTGPVPTAQSLPSQETALQNWPTAGDDDWAVIGPYVYYRGNATDWGSVVSANAVADLDQVVSLSQSGRKFDSQSLVNEAPSFLSYTIEEGSDQKSQSVILENGNLSGSPMTFSNEKLFAGSNSGQSAQGPRLFVSYPASDTSPDQATSLTLHQYAGYAVEGPITHYAVTLVSMDDGYQDAIPTAFEPDLATAGCDASGTVVKYYQNTVYPGASDPASAAYGRTVSQYLNGLNDLTGDNYYDMLDGMLIATNTYDAGGTSVKSTTTTWRVFEQVASSPTDASAPLIPLRGGWVAQVAQTTAKNGVETSTISRFVPAGLHAPFTGQPILQSQTIYSGGGQQETLSNVTLYGVHINPALVAIHAYGDVAQVAQIWQAGSGEGQPTPLSSTATTYTGWDCALEGVKAPAPQSGFALLDGSDPQFPYAAFTPGTVPDGWQLSAHTTARTRYGQESENVNALGDATATLFDVQDELAVARISNATLEGCAYTGFQAYEDFSAWQLTGVTFDNNDAFTGKRSAVLGGGQNASAAVTVSPRKAETYLVGCRYRTDSGFTAGGGELQAVVTVNDSPQTPVVSPFEDTKGAWKYVSLPVPVTASGDAPSISITVTASNASSQSVLLDSLLVAPLVNGTTARTFDPATQLVTSTIDAGGRTSRTYYSRANAPTVSVGASGRVRELSMRFQSRSGSADGLFSPDSPNAELTLHPASGGILETFRDGGAWASRWTASDSSSWATADGALTHSGTTEGTLTWNGSAGPETYAIYFEVQSDSSTGISIQAGDVTVGWTTGGWTGSKGSQQWTPLAHPPLGSQNWMLVVGDGVVLFFGNGQLLFSEKVVPTGENVALTLTGPGSVRNLTVVSDVRLGCSYNDGASRQRQVHQLSHADTVISEVIYDSLNRNVATTKSAPGSFGSGSSVAVMKYRSGFVNVAAFLQSLTGNWKMQGDVADYYAGQTVGTITRSDDGGYPYWGTRYENSPRNLKVEIGQPGEKYAINLTVDAGQRRTTQYTYGKNTGTNPSLPAGEYFANTLTSPIKTESMQLADQRGQVVGNVFHDTAGALASQSAGNRVYTDGANGPAATLTETLPNALIPGPQQNASDFTRSTVTNALKDTQSITDVDTGETQFIHDANGNLRFVRPAQEQSPSWFIYYKYDAVGRMTEEGTAQGDWNTTTLQSQADDPDFPTANTVTAVTTQYDGDGSDPTLIGKKWKSTSANPEPESAPGSGACTVNETLSYNEAGQLISIAQDITGSVTESGTIEYSYDVLGEVTRVGLPSGAPISDVYYGYDDQGRVETVGTTSGGHDLGRFTYSADGGVETQQLANNWVRSINYNSPTWVHQITAASASGSENLSFAMTYEADGAMESRQTQFSFSDDQTYSDRFQYDGQRQLKAATGSSEIHYTTYDPNGNLWELEDADGTSHFTAVDGSDRLQSIVLHGGPETPVSYDPQGRMTSGNGRTFEYDTTTSMTTTVTTSESAIRLAYGGTQQRVLKQVTKGGGDSTVYFNGSGSVPVAMKQGSSWTVPVYGPTGLLACQSDRMYVPLADTAGSIWAVLADDELVGGLNYLPFGNSSNVSGSLPPGMPFRFQGQEWDAEVGLYNFHARMYDPILRRFLAPDPQRQFASPYVFAANNPLTVTDPTGEISIWAQVGIGVAVGLVTVVGVGLTLFTGGASDAAAAGVDAALLGTDAAVEGAAVAADVAAAGAEAGAAGAEAGAAGAAGAAEAGAAGAAEAGAEASVAGAEGAAAGGAEASGEVAAGASTSEAAASGSSWSWSNFATQVAGSTLSGAGSSGLSYDIQHGRDFTAKGFFEAMGIGAVSGFVSGGLGQALSPVSSALTTTLGGSLGAKVFSGALTGAISGAITGDVTTILTNLSQHEPWYQGLGKSTLEGAGKGALKGGGKVLGGAALDKGKSLIGDARMAKLTTMLDNVKTAATSQNAYAIYGTAAFFAVSGYSVWGVAEWSSKHSG